MKTITDCSLVVEEYPLIKPYHLSFTTLHAFRSVQVCLTVNSGERRTAEVVALPGYSEESEDDVVSFLTDKLAKAVGMSLADFRIHVFDGHSDPAFHFSRTAALTAVDLFDFNLRPKAEWEGLDTIIPTSTELPDALADTLECVPEGTTVKVKLSGDAALDLHAMKGLNPARRKVRLRLDANQAYTVGSASEFLSDYIRFPAAAVTDYLEQPLHVSDWTGQAELVQAFKGFQFMLDESVYSRKEIERCAGMGISYVKLKLFKQGGILELIDQAKHARQLGLRVVLGNGVATAVSNAVELSVFLQHQELFTGPHEANGYLKVK